MSTIEIVLNMLAEASTTEISKEVKPKNFDENKSSKVRRKCCWKCEKRNRRQQRSPLLQIEKTLQ